MIKSKIIGKCSALVAITVVAAVLFLLKACAQEPADGRIGNVIMTTQAREVQFQVTGTDIAIDWSDGRRSNTNDATFYDEDIGRYYFSHEFSRAAAHTIVITGNVTKLDCSGMGLIALDVSRSAELTELRCRDNRITRLDVSQNTTLSNLDCGQNQLTSLDVSQNTALKNLDSRGNPLTIFDVSKNIALESLGFGGNQLTFLDVSRNTALIELHVNNTTMTSIDLSNNSTLRHLSVERNQLMSLDLSANTALTFLSIGGNQFTASALNDLFSSLPDNPNPGTEHRGIAVGGNPGTFEADYSIAAKKGWSTGGLYEYYNPTND